MRRFVMMLALSAALPTAAWAQTGARSGPPSPEQRAELEARVIQRFIQQTSGDLRLTPEATTRLELLFRQNMAARRQVARSASELRRRLQQAVEAGTASEAHFARMLSELESLRAREHDLEQREQAALAEFLTARQRAILSVHWFRMQENMREVMARREGGPPRHD